MASPIPRFAVVVVLVTPPFWLHIAMTFVFDIAVLPPFDRFSRPRPGLGENGYVRKNGGNTKSRLYLNGVKNNRLYADM
jgi:hypothetical protein